MVVLDAQWGQATGPGQYIVNIRGAEVHLARGGWGGPNQILC